MRLKEIATLFSFVLIMGACSVPKDVTYLQGIDDLSPEMLQKLNQAPAMVIGIGDLLNITVTAWDPTVVTPFNPPVYAYAKEGDVPVLASNAMYNYLVDNNGNINFPVLGEIQVKGYTRQELTKILQERIAHYIKDPLVNIQITNYVVTILGEVNRPGALTVRNDRLSILDAVGQAGDLTINGDRKNILVVREKNGQKQMGRMDLTQPDIFASPYFYLQQNDIVYIEPNDAKKKNARYSQAQQYSITVISSVLSAISVLTSVIVALSK